jgi:hypothetical protein
MADAQLRTLLSTLDPKARDNLRNVLIRDQADRDAIASRLMRYRDKYGQGWAGHRWPDVERAGREGASEREGVPPVPGPRHHVRPVEHPLR